MSINPESIQVGECYLMQAGQVRRVLRVMPDGRIQYEYRPPHLPGTRTWKSGMQSGRSFADLVERVIPCDWTPGTDV